MSDVTVCPECDRWMRIDNFNGMARCTTTGCSRDGVYLTRDEVQRIRDERNAPYERRANA